MFAGKNKPSVDTGGGDIPALRTPEKGGRGFVHRAAASSESEALRRLMAVFSETRENEGVAGTRAALIAELKPKLNLGISRIPPEVMKDEIVKGGPALAEKLLQDPGVNDALVAFENAVKAAFGDSAPGGQGVKKGLGKKL